MRQPLNSSGFRPPSRHPLGRERRAVALAELVATLALALCTVIAATVLTIGIARASAVDGVIGHEDGLFGVALLLGLIFIGVGSLADWPRKNR